MSEDCNSYDDIYESLPPYLRGYFDSAFRAQLDIFGDNIFDRILTPDILAELSECVDFRQDENSFSDIKLIFTNTFLGYKMAQTERIECLNLLAKAAKVDLYTDDLAKDRLRNVIIRGTVSYFNDMPKVFAASKINMNFTIRNVQPVFTVYIVLPLKIPSYSLNKSSTVLRIITVRYESLKDSPI